MVDGRKSEKAEQNEVSPPSDRPAGSIIDHGDRQSLVDKENSKQKRIAEGERSGQTNEWGRPTIGDGPRDHRYDAVKNMIADRQFHNAGQAIRHHMHDIEMDATKTPAAKLQEQKRYITGLTNELGTGYAWNSAKQELAYDLSRAGAPTGSNIHIDVSGTAFSDERRGLPLSDRAGAPAGSAAAHGETNAIQIAHKGPESGKPGKEAEHTKRPLADNKKELPHPRENATSDKFAETEKKALELIARKMVETANRPKPKEGKSEAAPPPVKKGGDINVRIKGAGEIFKDIQTLWETSQPGDLKQETVSDLGIEAIPVADLQNSADTTSKVDKALHKAQLDPKNYNCNDYVKMFVLSQKSDTDLQDFMKTLTQRFKVDSPEVFLKLNGYSPITQGPLKEADIIVIHGANGEHAAVISMDKRTQQLYTMQKPNSNDMPVKMSFDQFVRAEKVSGASVEVYRKK